MKYRIVPEGGLKLGTTHRTELKINFRRTRQCRERLSEHAELFLKQHFTGLLEDMEDTRPLASAVKDTKTAVVFQIKIPKLGIFPLKGDISIRQRESRASTPYSCIFLSKSVCFLKPFPSTRSLASNFTVQYGRYSQNMSAFAFF